MSFFFVFFKINLFDVSSFLHGFQFKDTSLNFGLILKNIVNSHDNGSIS